MELAKKATRFMLDNKHTVNKTYRSIYHMEPTLGWMNDPNGLIFVDGEFHLFYQSNVYENKANNISWGHFISEDLIKYKEVDNAIYPDGSEYGETGSFTGSGFIENNELKLVYTKHLEKDKPCNNVEKQYICTTDDKISFIKEDSPCIDENELPSELARNDFRDPQIFYFEDRCYLIIGGRTLDHKGVFIVYSGKDSSSLHYDFYFGPYENTRCMVECPSFMKVDNKDVIVYSSYGPTASNGVYYILGKFLPNEKTFVVEGEDSLDFGDAYYAPKVIENYHIPTIIAWLENWNKRYPTQEMNHNWVGSYTIPRTLSIKDNKLHQYYHPNLDKYIIQNNVISNGKVARSSVNSFVFENDFELILKGIDGSIRLYKEDNYIYLDTTKSNNLHEMIFKSKYEYERGNITFLLDTSSIEIFINDGIETVSSRFYILGDKLDISLSNIKEINTKEIEVK